MAAQPQARQQKKSAAVREMKAGPHYVKAIDGRTVTGIFSVQGNKDSYGDILHPGCFAKTFMERGPKVLHLWQHEFWSPPIAVVRTLRELRRDELPPEMLSAYPEALGGAEVTREYLDTPRANEVLENIRKDVPLQMSFGFDPLRYDFEEDPESEWGMIRHVREVRLWETSDVLWGANSATMATRMPLDMLLQQLEIRAQELRAGARHSKKDVELLNQIHRYAVDLGATDCAGFVSDAEDEDNEKARAAPTAQQQAPADLPPAATGRAEELRAGVLALAAGRKAHAPVGVTALWLGVADGKATLAAEIEGHWRRPVAELDIRADGLLINQLLEVADISSAPLDPWLNPENNSNNDADQRRAAKDDSDLALTLARARLFILQNT